MLAQLIGKLCSHRLRNSPHICSLPVWLLRYALLKKLSQSENNHFKYFYKFPGPLESNLQLIAQIRRCNLTL